MSKRLHQNRIAIAAVYALASLFSLMLFLKNAWVAEDAFIILRSVEQFLLGHGFRWNPHERVQVYTSPLWYLLLIASTLFCKMLYLNLIGLSLLLHTALLGAMAALINNVWRWLAAVLMLTFSQGFFDFTASGLEYPAIYLLLAIFTLLYLRDDHLKDRFWLACCAGLALITRHDLLFILAPMLLHLAWTYHKQLTLKQQLIVLGIFITPLTCWTLFSLIYYGLPFPNTAYAKLGIDGVSRLERLERGWIYFTVSMQTDPITPLCIAFAILRGLSAGNTVQRVCATALLSAFLYIGWIGADYMLGRFYAPLYLVATLLLIGSIWQQPFLDRLTGAACGLACGYMMFYTLLTNLEPIGRLIALYHLPSPTLAAVKGTIAGAGLLMALLSGLHRALRQGIAILLFIMLAVSTQQYDSPWQTSYSDWGKRTDFDMWWNMNNVSRERYFIYHWTSLYTWANRDPAKPFPDHPWCTEGLAMPAVGIIGFAGMTPYCMGTDKIAVDIKAITDPLLTRMPKAPDTRWTSGGVNRLIPAGYIDSLSSGENRIADPDLAQYYDKLVILTQSEPLFSAERLRTIVAFNLGFYNHWLTAHNARLAQTTP